MSTPAYPAPELMELAQSEPLRVLHHDHRGVGHIHPHLNHCGGNQDIRIMGGESGHHRLLFPGLHLSVDRHHPQIWKDLLPEHSGIGRYSLPLIGQFVVFLHHGADNINLSALRHQFAKEGVHPGAVAAGNGIGGDAPAAGGKLVDNGYLQVPI